jgi:WD40 repeat protein
MTHKTTFRLCILMLLCMLVALPLKAQQRCQPPAPLTTSPEPNFFTEEQEVDLGDAIAEHIQHNFRVINDEEVTGYLTRIGERIIKHLPPSKLRFQFFLIDLPQANAFVLPGGRIYVSRKLISFAQNEDELAGVISHEMGHLLARQGSIEMSRRMKEVLGVTGVTDRKDIFEKYNQLVENAARKPKAFTQNDEEKDQIVADTIGLYALASAGYDPQAHPRFWDRFTESKGKTGGFLSDLFGTTKPESKRLREMIKANGTLPAACIEARVANTGDEFQKWQAAVVSYTGLGVKESLHNVVSKTMLNPALRGQVTHLRFSPDGKYVLAQDDSGINVLSREPFAPLFRIEAPEASHAQFTPDSQDIIFYNSDLRVEVWNVADEKLKAAHEIVVRKRCLQSALAPDGKMMACLDADLNLDLFDVDLGTQVYQKKSFYTPSFIDLFTLQLLSILNADELSEREVEWINMGFSPDSHYFVAGQRTTSLNSLGNLSQEVSSIAIDLGTRAPVSLRGPLKKMLAGHFTFFGPDKIIGPDREDPKKSVLVSFPAGEIVDQLPAVGTGKLAASTHGNYLLVRPISKYAVGVMDLTKKSIFMANKESAFDIYDDMFVSERVNGELGLYRVDKSEAQSVVILPRNSLGRIRASALSPDFKWLAISERARGAVWNLSKGERVAHVRGFRGGYFGEDGAFYADFPKFEQMERSVARVDLNTGTATAGPQIEAYRAWQAGPFILSMKPAKKDGGYNGDVLLNVSDSRNLKPLWSMSYPKEAPEVWIDAPDGTMVLSWAVSTNAAKIEVKSDPALNQQLAAMKEKEGDYFLQILDARTGAQLGHLLIETGKGSFRISDVFAVKDWVVISDTQNRVLVYSLKTGEQKGKMFGGRASVGQASGLLCVENEKGQLTLYDLASMEKRDQFSFSSPVALTRFSPDGKSLFVLTTNQTAYVLDVSSKTSMK